jgi:hypothetical protein
MINKNSIFLFKNGVKNTKPLDDLPLKNNFKNYVFPTIIQHFLMEKLQSNLIFLTLNLGLIGILAI